LAAPQAPRDLGPAIFKKTAGLFHAAPQIARSPFPILNSPKTKKPIELWPGHPADIH